MTMRTMMTTTMMRSGWNELWDKVTREATDLQLGAGIVSSGNAWEQHSQSYFDSGNDVPKNTIVRQSFVTLFVNTPPSQQLKPNSQFAMLQGWDSLEKMDSNIRPRKQRCAVGKNDRFSVRFRFYNCSFGFSVRFLHCVLFNVYAITDHRLTSCSTHYAAYGKHRYK